MGSRQGQIVKVLNKVLTWYLFHPCDEFMSCCGEACSCDDLRRLPASRLVAYSSCRTKSSRIMEAMGVLQPPLGTECDPFRIR